MIEITEKQAILLLINSGWLVNHDKELRERWERPQGVWIDHSDEGYIECPFCGEATNCEDNKDELHFCWNCGAQMVGG